VIKKLINKGWKRKFQMTLSNSSSETYDLKSYDKPSVTVDVLVFTITGDELKVLLVKRGSWPYENYWALPGGFVKMNESLEAAAIRELEEESGVKDVYLEQLYTFGDPDRDPRTRVITVAYIVLINSDDLKLRASTDVRDAQWFSIKKLPDLAFDHKKIVEYGLNRLRSKLGYSNIAYGLLPPEFRLSELQKVYEIILDRPLDKRNFRKKILSLTVSRDEYLLEATGEREISGAHRPAMLYRFNKKEIVFFD
jgi:8-oxo-dGTP diphosphatase